jgi:hypothetical protein
MVRRTVGRAVNGHNGNEGQGSMAGTRRLTNLTTGGPVHVDVEGGRIVRIIPLQLDENDDPGWRIHARGRVRAPADHALALDCGPQVHHLRT